MNDKKLPPGIRTLTNKDGSIRYEARVNRNGIAMSKGFPSKKQASAWKTRTDALIDSGINPKELPENIRKPKRKSAASETAPPSPTSMGDRPRAPKPDMTVEEAVTDYLAFRSRHHTPLKSNQISEFERVRDDLGNLKITNMVNEEIVEYISELLRTPRKRDDPEAMAEMNQRREAKRLQKLKAQDSPSTEPTAKARANARYKEKLRKEREKARQDNPPVPKLLSEATVRKYVQALRTVINWAAKNNDVPVHPKLFEFGEKDMPAAWNGQRERRLFEGEEEKLYAAGIDRGGYTYTSDDWRAMIGFALETAMREQEIALAKFKDIEAGGYKLVIPRVNSKTNKKRTALLTKRAREIIALQRASAPAGSERIFHQFPNAGAICDAFANLTKRAGVADLTFHDLRHEATSRLCESGKLSTMELMEMTGHDTMKTFIGYIKLIAHENQRRLD